MDHYRLLRRLLNGVRCKGCGQRYGCGRVRTLARKKELWLLATSCRRCRTSGVVAVLPQEGRAAEIVSDLTEGEMARWPGMQPVTGDDVLAMHLSLRDFQGDFQALLREAP